MGYVRQYFLGCTRQNGLAPTSLFCDGGYRKSVFAMRTFLAPARQETESSTLSTWSRSSKIINKSSRSRCLEWGKTRPDVSTLLRVHQKDFERPFGLTKGGTITPIGECRNLSLKHLPDCRNKAIYCRRHFRALFLSKSESETYLSDKYSTYWEGGGWSKGCRQWRAEAGPQSKVQ